MQCLKQQTEFRNQSVPGKKKVCIQIMTPISSNIDYIFDHIGHPRVGRPYPWGCFPPCNTTLGAPNVWAHNWGRKMHQPLPQHQRPGSYAVIMVGIFPHIMLIYQKNRQHDEYIYMIYDIHIYIYLYIHDVLRGKDTNKMSTTAIIEHDWFLMYLQVLWIAMIWNCIKSKWHI